MDHPDRAVVVTMRGHSTPDSLEVWVSLYGGPEIAQADLLLMRGPCDRDDLPFAVPDMLCTLVDYVRSLVPLLF